MDGAFKRMSAAYRLYGLILQTELEFPELEGLDVGSESRPEPDVVLVRVEQDSLGCFEVDDPDAPIATRYFHPRPEGCDLIWEGDARVRIESGRRIAVATRDGVDQGALRAALLGPVMALLLAQRALLPLHASAVSARGPSSSMGSVAFAGNSGAGKSTVAAALLERGHRLFADDVSAIDLGDDPPSLRAAFACQKLDPDSLSAIGSSPEGLRPVHALESKRVRPVGSRFAVGAAPLLAFCVLAPGERPRLVRLEPQDAFVELLRNTFRPELVRALQGEVAHMQAVTGLAARVPVWRLERPWGFDDLEQMLDLIEERWPA
jgi:hypothetical protein